MTDLKELKQNVLMTAKKAYDEKLMAGTSGNISAYFREKQWIVITPSSYDYSLMAEEDIVVIDLDGNLVEGRHKPSSEWKMHAEIYRHLSHANAVVHTHSPYILNSISNARAYDLERHVALDNLSAFSSDDLAEGYFEADEYSDELKKQLARYEILCFSDEVTEEERAERAELRIKLKNMSSELSGTAKEKFEDIERRRKLNDQN